MRSQLLIAVVLSSTPLTAQDIPVVTAEDYARAERTLAQNTAPLVFGATVQPTWLDGDRFWFRNAISEGTEFVLVDARDRSNRRAFDHTRLAEALSMVSDSTVAPFALPFSSFTFTSSQRSIAFEIGRTGYTCDIQEYRCTSSPSRSVSPGSPSTSPDGRQDAFIRDHNLWVRDLESGAETQLTTDGVEDFGYATNNAGWVRRDTPVVLWSPDSRKIATFQHDGRGVGDMYLVSTNVGHPRLEAWKYPLPEDSVIFRIHRVVVDVATRGITRLQMPPDQHRSTVCDHVVCRGQWADIEWSPDGSQLIFVSSSRNHQQAKLRIADVSTGVVRDIMEENVDTFFESGYNMVNWRALAESDEFIWYSQRDNWGHLYLYDLQTGGVKNRITSGDWNVLQLRHVDHDSRTLYFTGAGREAGDPYYEYFYSIRMDGSDLRLLTPETANHEITMSPSGNYFVDSYSTPTEPPTTVVRDTRGRERLLAAEANIEQLAANNWQAPIPFTVKARDGETDLYGLMYRPSTFDSTKSYPIVNYLYPGPQTGSVGSRSFRPARGDKQAIAELGFIVVEVDAMGTPKRSKSFHAAYYGNMGDNGLPDQIATIRQLAERHSYMDIDRVGIYGHSGGGFASAAGIMRYPDFYKVAVSQAGNHDNRNYEDDWGEKWQGLLEDHNDGTTSYDNQANQLQAENLRGKLMLAHGTMDNNVPPSNTMLVVDALIAANKDFDLVLFPNRRHGFGNEEYMMRRRWDYFVRHLLGADPPAEYEFGQISTRTLIP